MVSLRDLRKTLFHHKPFATYPGFLRSVLAWHRLLNNNRSYALHYFYYGYVAQLCLRIVLAGMVSSGQENSFYHRIDYVISLVLGRQRYSIQFFLILLVGLSNLVTLHWLLYFSSPTEGYLDLLNRFTMTNFDHFIQDNKHQWSLRTLWDKRSLSRKEFFESTIWPGPRWSFSKPLSPFVSLTTRSRVILVFFYIILCFSYHVYMLAFEIGVDVSTLFIVPSIIRHYGWPANLLGLLDFVLMRDKLLYIFQWSMFLIGCAEFISMVPLFATRDLNRIFLKNSMPKGVKVLTWKLAKYRAEHQELVKYVFKANQHIQPLLGMAIFTCLLLNIYLVIHLIVNIESIPFIEGVLFLFLFTGQLITCYSILLPMAAVARKLHSGKQLVLMQARLGSSQLWSKLKLMTYFELVHSKEQCFGFNIGPAMFISQRNCFDLLFIYMAYTFFILDVAF